jgi:hypothetical protein
MIFKKRFGTGTDYITRKCIRQVPGSVKSTIGEASVAQPFYTRGTLNIVEESWRHTNPILHIVGGGVMALIGRDNFLQIDPNRKMLIIIHLYYYVIYFKYIHYLK